MLKHTVAAGDDFVAYCLPRRAFVSPEFVDRADVVRVENMQLFHCIADSKTVHEVFVRPMQSSIVFEDLGWFRGYEEGSNRSTPTSKTHRLDGTKII